MEFKPVFAHASRARVLSKIHCPHHCTVQTVNQSTTNQPITPGDFYGEQSIGIPSREKVSVILTFDP